MNTLFVFHPHFPAAGTPGKPRLVNGVLYSVNPVALRRSLRYLAEKGQWLRDCSLSSPRRWQTRTT